MIIFGFYFWIKFPDKIHITINTNNTDQVESDLENFYLVPKTLSEPLPGDDMCLIVLTKCVIYNE